MGREGREVKRGYFATLISGGPRVGTVSPVFDYTPGIALTRESFDEVPPRNVANKTTSSVITDITESPGQKPTGHSGTFPWCDTAALEVNCADAAAAGTENAMTRCDHRHAHYKQGVSPAGIYTVVTAVVYCDGSYICYQKREITIDSCGHVTAVSAESDPIRIT